MPLLGNREPSSGIALQSSAVYSRSYHAPPDAVDVDAGELAGGAVAAGLESGLAGAAAATDVPDGLSANQMCLMPSPFTWPGSVSPVKVYKGCPL